METKNTTFWNLIKESKINIPIIQRDYAQGRSDEKERREKFLDAIFVHLHNKVPLHLDFVYGKFDPNNNTLFPIDGQQRLTTLFLLHWYIALKEQYIVEKSTLANFTYDTRISSREFCKALIVNEIIIPSVCDLPKADEPDNAFIEQIKNYPWFRYDWENDPTISAMLIMIQAIHNKFNGLGSVWEKLTIDNLISFEVLDLGAKGFELTDELYIKMNARGKQLTEFENFKADFILFIDINFKDKKLPHPYEISKEISYRDFFAFKIEKEWTDLFWVFRDEQVVIDDMFMNYLSVITQLCYFKDNLGKKAEDFRAGLSIYQHVFMNEENLLFLFSSLDLLHSIGINSVDAQFSRENFCRYFETVFLDGSINEKYNAQVRLFWNDDKYANIFERCINEGLKFDVRNQIILYSLLRYKIDNPQSNETQYIRIIRNLLQATRQRNDTKYNMNIRINEFGNYLKLFEQLSTKDVYQTICHTIIDNKDTKISDEVLKNEKDKATLIMEGYGNAIFRLEEFRYFGGLLHCLDPLTNKDKLLDYVEAVREIWSSKSISDILIVRALIASGFRGIYIKNGGMGEMWYFGKTENWSTILTATSNVGDCIVKLLDRYLLCAVGTPKEKLETIVAQWKEENADKRNWKHYFMSYDCFLSSRYNYFAWGSGFEIRMLGSEGASPLLAYHISPYVLAVCRAIDDKSICDEAWCYQQYSGNSPLILKNGITLTCTNSGWVINTPEIVIPNDVLSAFNIQTNEQGIMLLTENNDMDRVEIAVEFCKSVFTENVC